MEPNRSQRPASLGGTAWQNPNDMVWVMGDIKKTCANRFDLNVLNLYLAYIRPKVI